MIRILHVVSIMDVGGMETYIMNMYRCMDRSKYQFDFLVHHMRRGVYEDEIESLGGKIYHLSVLDDFNFLKFRNDLNRLFRDHPEYRIVHGHLGSTAYWYLGAAQKNGVPWRILHGHIADYPRTGKGVIKHMLFHFSPKNSNVHLACSTEAGKYLFSKEEFEVIPNGINTGLFHFSEEKRDQIRRKLDIGNSFVLGHVGRLDIQKNHKYIVSVFCEVKKHIPDAKLLLIGKDVLPSNISAFIPECIPEDDIIMPGLISDVSSYYSAMDVFVMPSLFEGLPLVGVEAQCSSLPCLFSDKVSAEVKLSENVRFLPIERENIEDWTAEILKIYKKRGSNREVVSDAVKKYDVKDNTEKMLHRYEHMLESLQ